MEQRFSIATITGTAGLFLLSSLSVCTTAENVSVPVSKTDAVSKTDITVNVTKEDLSNETHAGIPDNNSDLVEVDGHLLFRSLDIADWFKAFQDDREAHVTSLIDAKYFFSFR
jgi:hypothetical protein